MVKEEGKGKGKMTWYHKRLLVMWYHKRFSSKETYSQEKLVKKGIALEQE